MKWYAMQAVALDEYGDVKFRTFPFWALSLEAARLDLIEMEKTQPSPITLTHIFQYGALHQKAGKVAKFNGEKNAIVIATGRKY